MNHDTLPHSVTRFVKFFSSPHIHYQMPGERCETFSSVKLHMWLWFLET